MGTMRDEAAEIENEDDDALLPEYRFDYSKARLNRFALAKGTQLIALDPDVAVVFQGRERVEALKTPR